jgi:uncharacterized protein (DUF1684 family)
MKRFLVVFLGLVGVLAAQTPANYQQDMQKWRERRISSVQDWLKVVGLYWLKEGENPFGSDQSNPVMLPAGAPAKAGVFELHDGKVSIRVNEGVPVTANAKPVKTMELKLDTTGTPDKLTLGTVTFWVIKRGDRYGVRMVDQQSKAVREFKGLQYFPVKPQSRVKARFVPQESKVPIPNVLGQVEDAPSPGYAEFILNGKQYRLTPITEPGESDLFFIFRDQTSGKETYPAGRFLYADPPKDGKVVLDFNKAYNPPCAWTPYATCPLPPRQNILQVRIEAGEKYTRH